MLGPVEVRDGDRRLPLGSPRKQALLARLALDLGRPVAAARLLEDLWGEDQPPTAAKMIQVYVSQLRKVLPDGLLVTRGNAYALEADPETLDLHRFERLHREGADALASGDPARAATRLREALALWRGPALTEFPEPFAAPEAARLEEARLACLEHRIDADLALGRHADLVGELEALVERQPLRERSRRQLMLALYRAGRQAEALEAYAAYRAMLDDQLGLVPSPALQELQALILRQAPELEPPRPRAELATGDASGVRYVEVAGGRLAYAINGEGPPIVRVATWLTSLDADWESPVWRHWLEGLTVRRTLVRYDERGCGLSDKGLGEPSLDQWVDDLAAVVDDAGVERFDLLGVSQGGAIAVAYAVRHPERVRKLVLYGAYLRGRRMRANPEQARDSEALATLMRKGWGSANPAFRRVFTNLFIPDGTEEQRRWYDELQLRTTTGDIAATLRRARDRIDVVDLGRRVTQPALVVHASGDRLIPVDEGRLMAATIPGARYVELATRNHILLSDELSWGVFLGTLDSFLDDGVVPGEESAVGEAFTGR